jgi:NitT/TauT family transport system ATP-binding protein
MTLPPRLQLRDVYKTFPTGNGVIEAVRAFSLEVATNEIVCLLGPSGCGKTTILNLIAGFFSPSDGEILIDGNPVVKPSRRCGMVFQGDAIFPWMTVGENISYAADPTRFLFFGSRIRKLIARLVRRIEKLMGRTKVSSSGQSRVDELVSIVGLSTFKSLWPRELSGGMKKRVDLARAYAADPELLLMDEPFGSLDVLTKEAMQLQLLDLWGRLGKTVLFVTHDVEEALLLGNRIAIMSASPGTAAHIYHVPFSYPRHPSLKYDDSFLRLRREITEILRSEQSIASSLLIRQ